MTESITDATRRAWVDVDLTALRENARLVAGRAGAPLLPMIKADGYGLGAVAVARALEPLDPFGFGVATVEEAAALRAAGVTRPVLALSPLLPGSARACLAAEARPCIGDLDALEAWLALGNAPFHVEIDTGMARAGFLPDDRAVLARLRDLLIRAPGWEGIFTHFHSADIDPDSARPQWEQLQEVITTLGRRPPLVHAASSGGVFAGSGYGADLARPGIFLYGGRVGAFAPQPVARFLARVVALRRMRAGDTASYGATWTAERPVTIATVGAGYADGIPRSLAARGRIQVGDTAFPIAGRVTMDLTLIDVGDTPIAIGDAATIWGGRVSLDEQAANAGTVSYELLTALGSRVTRRYSQET